MPNKISVWYKKLSPLKNVVLTFLSNFIYWFIGWLVIVKFFMEENRSWNYYFFYAFVQAFFMTLVIKWSEIKKLLKRNKS